jgi:hypothetical protein
MKKYGIFSLLVCLFFSCVEEEKRIHPPVSVQEKDVMLTMQIPGAHLPVTYAYSQTDENDIRTVDILLFRADSSGNEYYYRHLKVPAIKHDEGAVKKVQIRLEPIDVRAIVLANVSHLFTPQMLGQLASDSIAGNVSKEKLLNRFVFDWAAPTGNETIAFPMYGESAMIRATDLAANDIRMIRAITRIDIVNSITSKQVVIDSVYVFQAKNKGFVPPSFDVKGEIIETPHVPVQAQPLAKPLAWQFVQNAGVASISMEREIYLVEDGQDSGSPTTIVLKMRSEGKPAQCYKVDLRGKDGNLLPFQRNCRYRINVTDLKSEGYDTPEAAAAQTDASASTTVEANELGISTVVFNDQYKLGVATTDVFFKADGSWDKKKNNEPYYTLNVHTTYSSWSADWNEKENTWLHVLNPHVAGSIAIFPSSSFDLNLSVDPNTTGKARTGKIELRAGTLRLDINIIQYSGQV